jgi:transcription elongation factor Elf1
MARPNKQMPGRTYHIAYNDDSIATVECTYLCPYCNQDTTSGFTAKIDTFDLLERGVFFESLKCDLCGKVTDVRFMSNTKV